MLAMCVFAVAALILATGAYWLFVPLFAGFVLRVVAGPSLSPFALLATRVVAPRLGPPKDVAGPPKRFAQALGAVMSGTGAVLALAAGAETAAAVVAVLLLVAAGLEAFAALCLGCKLFAVLMRLGVIPDEVCAECAAWRPTQP